MPTYMGTKYHFEYDLGSRATGDAEKRYSRLEACLRGILGKSTCKIEQSTIDGGVVAAFDIIVSTHPGMQSHPMLYSPDRSCTRTKEQMLERLAMIEGYIRSSSHDIMYWT